MPQRTVQLPVVFVAPLTGQPVLSVADWAVAEDEVPLIVMHSPRSHKPLLLLSVYLRQWPGYEHRLPQRIVHALDVLVGDVAV